MSLRRAIQPLLLRIRAPQSSSSCSQRVPRLLNNPLAQAHGHNSSLLPSIRAANMSSDAAPPSAAETDSQAAAVANTTGVTPDTLKASLTEKLGAEYVEVDDISGGCGQSFQAVIVSPQFDGKRSLARHRLVNSALQAEIAAIHAWTPKCYTPEEWEKQRGG